MISERQTERDLIEDSWTENEIKRKILTEKEALR